MTKPLRFSQFNTENLFVIMDLYQGQDLKNISEYEWQKCTSSVTNNKPIGKLWEIAKIIKDMDPDVLMLNEVGGFESLENFNNHFLGNAFTVHLKEGNSNRGIDVGYLLKKSLNFKPVLLSHKNRPLQFLYPHENQTPSGGKSHYFSRDVAELRLFRKAENSPSLVVLLVHLKSKLDPENVDPQGRLRRTAELRTLIEIYNDIRKELGHTPVIVAGDFNGIANKRRPDFEPEFEQLYLQSNLYEMSDLVRLPLERCYTQVQINPLGKQTFIQLDYIFVSPELKDKIRKDLSQVWYFKGSLGQELPPPKTINERMQLPSDHYPVLMVVDIPEPTNI
jgi:endonuclease/exonuclease/phosphatase family metal-dependent hydrolase